MLLRQMQLEDVPAVLAVQEPAAIRGLGRVFPQAEHPFPRDVVGERWRAEITDPQIDCYVVTLDDTVAGFAATRRDEFLHFGTATEHWGSGLATRAHDEVIHRLREQGHTRAWLLVFTDNGRGRRFYEKLGWRPTGQRTTSSFPPHPELLRYERPLATGGN